MKKIFINRLVIFLLLFFPLRIISQDLTSIGQEKPFKVSGGISLNQVGYFQSGEEQSRRKPYSYILSGNVNFSIYGWAVPLSVTYSNQEGSFQQPFNQYGLTPTYKWIKTYIGYNSINFSKYTLSSYRFLGGGIELTPGDFRTTIFCGRLQKPVEYDTINQTNIMAYQRMGYGMNVGYTLKNYSIDVMAFYAKDDTGSLSNVPAASEVTPAENLVLGINGGLSIIKNLSLRVEYANSAFTSDLRTPFSEKNVGWNASGYFLAARRSTSFRNALNSSLTYAFSNYSVGINYERVDPDYHTLGAYYSTNDLENISLNGSASFWEGKLSTQVNAGMQRNDLNGSKASKMNNFVGSLTINATLSEKINVSASYSNYRNYTNIKSQFDYINQSTPWQNLDTLDFTQLTQNASANVSYTPGNNENRKHTLTTQFSFQDAAEKQGYYKANAGSQFYNGNLGYTVNFVPVNLGISITGSASYMTSALSKTFTYGPVLSANKSFFEGKLKNGLSFAWNQGCTDGQTQNTTTNTRYNINYTLKEKHNFTFSAIYLWRNSVVYETSKLHELTLTLSYGWVF